ncbi:hypothetical protein ACEQ8H_002042 [Pleosporales sp. CAS-2024a]
MRTSAMLAALALAATSTAQSVPVGIAPAQGPPDGCEPNANGNFTIGTLKLPSRKRDAAAPASGSELVCSLKDGVLTDRDGRIGSIVANQQFQFDGPPQAGAIYTGGFAICSNGSLAMGPSTRWWQCSSGSFYNLYDAYIGAQCEEIRIQVTFLQKPSSAAAGASTTTASLTVSVASVQSSLATISGSLSTVSKSAIGPSPSYTTSNVSATATATVTPSASPSLDTSAARSSSATRPAATEAPPAGAAVSLTVAKGSMMAAFVVIFGAALVL